MLGAESEAASDFAAGDSVTGFGAEDLAALGAQSIEDLAAFTPNLEIVTAGATTPTFFIRGVGLNDFGGNATGAVAIYQDDININAPALQLGSLFDTEAVNVERGPKGTGLGRNASAGAIRIYSRKPTGDFGGYLTSEFGNYHYMDYQGAVEAPIFEDMLSGRVAFRMTDRDGTMKNRCANQQALDQRARYPGLPASAHDSPWSHCGERVFFDGPLQFAPPDMLDVWNRSDLPEGLDHYVNDQNNWATRGSLLFEPNLDMTWLIGGHGSSRNERSRLGQSIGTTGSFCLNGKICQSVPPNSGVPFDLRDQTAIAQGLLGGPQNTNLSGYVPREITHDLIHRAPCFATGTCFSQNIPAAPNPTPPPNTLPGVPNPNPGPPDGTSGVERLAGRLFANQARIDLAENLAENLDSEPWEGDFNHTGPTSNETYGFVANGDIALPYDIQFTTHNGYDHYDRTIDIDLDFSPDTLFQIQTDDHAWQAYTDLNLLGELFSDTFPVRWEFGTWYLQEKLESKVVNDFGEGTFLGVGSRTYTQKIYSTAGYGAFSFDFWEDFTLDGGVRYNWERRMLDMEVVGGDEFNLDIYGEDETWHAPTGQLRLTYRFREDTHVYWKYSHGWKPGTYNSTASQFTGPTIADPENVDSFETGVRGAWLDGRIGLDTSLFYYKYQDYQIYTAIQFAGGNPEFVILNANDAEVYGAEVDAIGRPWTGAFVNVRFSWLKSQFLDFLRVDQFPPPQGGGGDNVVFRETQNSGNPLLNSPEFKVSITAEQSVPVSRYGTVTLRYDGVWTDITYFDATKGKGLGDFNGDKFLPDETIAQVPFWVHNLRLSWLSPDGRIELAGWVRNLSNNAYKTFAFDGSSFQSTTIYFVGDPRTYGGTVSFTF